MPKTVFSPAVAAYLMEQNVYADVDWIFCEACGEYTLPPTKVRDALVCPHDAELIDEAEYELEMSASACGDCGQFLVPRLQQPHHCEINLVS